MNSGLIGHKIDAQSRLVSVDTQSKKEATGGIVYQVTPKDWKNVQLLVEI
jgi:hypothetical protein